MPITGLPPADYQAGLSRPSRNSPADPFKSVAEYSDIQSAALPFLTPTAYCNRPELFLEEAAETYIPKNCYEEDDAYNIRLSTAYSSFQPFYRNLKNLTVGTALRKPISLAEDISTPDWETFFSNTTLEAESMTVFARRLLDASIDSGLAGILVDYPKTDGTLNLAQERSLGLRPYLQLIPFTDILGFQSTVETQVFGDVSVYGNRLTQLRIRDVVTEPDPEDEFHEITRPAVRVFDQPDANQPVTCRLFVLRPQEGNQTERWALVDETTLGITTIPFVPSYASAPDGFMRARPLLLDIARLNLSHWQTSADLAHSLHLTSTPQMVLTGVQAIGENGDLQVSPDRNIILSDPTSRAEWIGAPSDGSQVMIDRLKELEHAMFSLAPVQHNQKTTTGVEAAASKMMDRAQSDSVLSLIVSQLENSLNKALAICSLYTGWDMVELSLPRDFVPPAMEANEVKEWAALVASNMISQETFLRKLQAAELFDSLDEWSPEYELEKLIEEEPAVDPLGLPEEGLEDDEEGDSSSASTDSNPEQQEATEGDNKEVTVKVQAA